MGCIKCGGSYHPSNHVRTNPLSEALLHINVAKGFCGVY